MLQARLFVLLAAVLWSSAGTIIKLSSMTGWQLSAGRSGVAALFLWITFRDSRRKPDRTMAWVACAYAATVVLFVTANKLTTAANAIFIQDCAPLFVLLLSPLILGERATRSELLAAPVFTIGVLLFFADKLTPGQMHGNLVALGSGVAFAFCIMGLRRMRDGGGLAASAWGNLIAFAVSLPLALQGPAPTAPDFMVILFLGIFQLGLAYAAFSHGVKHVPAAEASLLVLLEPVLSSVWAWLFAGETPGPFAVLGGAIVLGATVWRTWAAARAHA